MPRDIRLIAATFLAATVIYSSGSWPWWSLVLAWLAVLIIMPPLRARTAGPTPRRGGYIAPQPSVSGGASPGTVARVRTYTGSLIPPGERLADVRAAFKPLAGPSRTIAPGSYMSSWGFAPGRLTTAADVYPDGSGPGDCGCGDTAA